MTNEANTWVCGHGRRHPNPQPQPGYAMCCSCPADAPWIGRGSTEIVTKPVTRHQELSNDEIDRATVDDLRSAYRALREHHIAETTALIGRRNDLSRRFDDLTRRCDEQLAKSAKVFTPRAADPADLATPDHLSDEELSVWAERAGIYNATMTTTYLRMIVDELRERRDAEALFTEIDRQFQAVDCQSCDDQTADYCEEHASLVKQWRCARAALCDLARIHRNYLRSLNAPDEGDPQ